MKPIMIGQYTFVYVKGLMHGKYQMSIAYWTAYTGTRMGGIAKVMRMDKAAGKSVEALPLYEEQFGMAKGFDWGCESSEAKQLAFCSIYDLMLRDGVPANGARFMAKARCEQFVLDCLRNIPTTTVGWAISFAQIRDWLKQVNLSNILEVANV